MWHFIHLHYLYDSLNGITSDIFLRRKTHIYIIQKIYHFQPKKKPSTHTHFCIFCYDNLHQRQTLQTIASMKLSYHITTVSYFVLFVWMEFLCAACRKKKLFFFLCENSWKMWHFVWAQQHSIGYWNLSIETHHTYKIHHLSVLLTFILLMKT